jgi:hypothetical protein
VVLPVFLPCGSDEPGDPGPEGVQEASGWQHMSRVYGEPVQVKARPDGRPVRFVWRSRLYTVRAIWEHWVINREWWREPADSGDAGTEPGQPELVFWRVEAAPGQGMTPGVYELRQDVATTAWTIRLT